MIETVRSTQEEGKEKMEKERPRREKVRSNCGEERKAERKRCRDKCRQK